MSSIATGVLSEKQHQWVEWHPVNKQLTQKTIQRNSAMHYADVSFYRVRLMAWRPSYTDIFMYLTAKTFYLTTVRVLWNCDTFPYERSFFMINQLTLIYILYFQFFF